MSQRKEWNNLLRVVVVLIGAGVSLLSIILAFYLKFMGDIPARNYAAFESSYLWIMLGFIAVSYTHL